MSVAIWSGSLVAWEHDLAALNGRIGPVFGKAETRETAGDIIPRRQGQRTFGARFFGWEKDRESILGSFFCGFGGSASVPR